jgi:hypothetical protein
VEQHRTKSTWAQQFDKIPIEQEERLSLVIFPLQEASQILLVTTMADILHDVRPEAEQVLLDTPGGDDVFNQQVQQSSFTERLGGILDGGPLALDIDSPPFIQPWW